MDIPLYEIKDGYQFQQLVAAYFRSLKGERVNYHLADIDVDCNGVGQDGGIDVVVTFHYLDAINKHQRRWIVECKCWNENRSFGLSDLDTRSIPSLLKAKNADGYLLVCKGNITNKLKDRFRELSLSDNGRISYEIWEGFMFWHKIIEREVLLQAYFPDFYNRKLIETKMKELFESRVAEFQHQYEKRDAK